MIVLNTLKQEFAITFISNVFIVAIV